MTKKMTPDEEALRAEFIAAMESDTGVDRELALRFLNDWERLIRARAKSAELPDCPKCGVSHYPNCEQQTTELRRPLLDHPAAKTWTPEQIAQVNRMADELGKKMGVSDEPKCDVCGSAQHAGATCGEAASRNHSCRYLERESNGSCFCSGCGKSYRLARDEPNPHQCTGCFLEYPIDADGWHSVPDTKHHRFKCITENRE